jgi:hypothetical protein|tara:strand:- start:7 stop:201 length:195 start_codon:yes stop_codon:yes gene_type:complete
MSTIETSTKGKQMTELQQKTYVVEMLNQGFALAPCANPVCEQLFASDIFCTGCEEEQRKENTNG